MIKFESHEELQTYLKKNLLPMEEARKITGQSVSAFTQSVATGKLIPYYQTTNESGRVQNKLFLKSDLEEYRKSKRTKK